MLDAHGLTARAGISASRRSKTQAERAVEIARQLGVEIVVAPYLTPVRTADDGRRLEGIGSSAGRGLTRSAFGRQGLRFAWHNHDFEFAAAARRLAADRASARRRTSLWEADLAWVTRGGGDPPLWIERYRGRIPLVHVKDIAPAGEKLDEDGWADVGTGVLPWPELWPHASPRAPRS